MVQRGREAVSQQSVDDITLEDYEDATDTITPDDIDWIGSERDLPRRPESSEEDEEVIEPGKSRLKTGWEPASEKLRDQQPRGTGIPTIDEWMDFFSRVVIRVATDFAIEMAFRGVDEDLL